jgi:hypothetical protein
LPSARFQCCTNAFGWYQLGADLAPTVSLSRYRRTAYDVLELSMIITNPKIYTRSWISETKRFRKLAMDSIKTVDGWTGLLEDVCAPADEVDIFDKRVRDPAGGVIR